MLWAFDFTPAIDPLTGKDVPLDPEAYTTGFLQCPEPFKVTVKIRSDEHLKTLRREYAGAVEFLKQYN